MSLINPSKALSSTGAFGGIFRQLRERAVGRTVSGKTDAATAEKLAMALSHDGKEITLRSSSPKAGGDAGADSLAPLGSVYIKAGYSERGEAKRLGARWDKSAAGKAQARKFWPHDKDIMQACHALKEKGSGICVLL